MKKKILFVDDDYSVLKGISRMLRGMRHKWDVILSNSGSEALKMMEVQPFDVIVSDIRMPKMNGADLLKIVKKKYPQTVRIILSGHADKKTILKTVRPTHRYISKPCDTEDLKSTIANAIALKDLLGADRLRSIVSQMEYIPSLPSLYSEILEEVNQKNPSMDRIGTIISQDLGMSAKILQIVNSSFFGLARRISSPTEAVVLLGIEMVKSLVLTIEIFAKFNDSKVNTRVVQDLYKHSLHTGIISKKIATSENMKKQVVDDSFMAGMLHDIGKLVIIHNLPEEYKTIASLASENNTRFHDIEPEILGATHAQVGGYLLGLWGLPDDIVEAVAFHHDPQHLPAENFGPLCVVHVADLLELAGSHSGKTSTGDDALKMMDMSYLKKLGLDERVNDWSALLLEE